jgi:predicted AlkP superfamily phosphohydrolase/phosphomutase
MHADGRDKLLAIGLDAGDFSFIRSRRAQLPLLAKLAETGFFCEPAAPKALTGSVWPTFYTGSHPGHHGIYQPIVWDAESMGLRLIGPDWCAFRPFWADLEDRGRNVIVLDVPYTFPVFLKRGVEISDWGTHGQTRPAATNRPDVRAFLRKFGASPIGRETPVRKNRTQLAAIHRQLLESVDRKRDLIALLMEQFDWDVFITTFAEVHRGGHTLYDEGDMIDSSADTPLLDIYRRVDNALHCILESLHPERTTVVFFSVHGMMRDHGQNHLVKPVMDRLNQEFLKRHLGREVRLQRTGGLIAWLRQTVPASLQYAIGEAAPDSVRRWVVEREIIGGVDWSQTPGFSLRTDIRAELRLNLFGRESRGILEPDSKLMDAYVDSLCRTLLELRDCDTGNLLVDEVIPIQTLFPGERSHALPDFCITWRPAPLACRVWSAEIGEVEARPSGARGGDHTDLGFVSVSLSKRTKARLDSNAFPPVRNIWDLGSLIKRLDELATA